MQSPFGLRDFIGYFIPGFIFLLSYAIVNPNIFNFLKDNQLLATAIILAGGYTAGHICKGVGILLLMPVRRKLGFNPYKNSLSEKKSNWSKPFRDDLLMKLKLFLSEEIYETEIQNKASNIIILCWYDTFNKPTKVHDEIERYVSLFNLFLALIPAWFILGISIYTKGNYTLLIPIFFLLSISIKLWYYYEFLFCINILRLWYLKYTKEKAEKTI